MPQHQQPHSHPTAGQTLKAFALLFHAHPIPLWASHKVVSSSKLRGKSTRCPVTMVSHKPTTSKISDETADKNSALQSTACVVGVSQHVNSFPVKKKPSYFLPLQLSARLSPAQTQPSLISAWDSLFGTNTQ